MPYLPYAHFSHHIQRNDIGMALSALVFKTLCALKAETFFFFLLGNDSYDSSMFAKYTMITQKGNPECPLDFSFHM